MNFCSLKKYDKLIVTGPQRSGTRIAAKIIAEELEWDFFDEARVDIGDINMIRSFIKSGLNQTVLQCPSFSHRCHETPDNVGIVFMKRDPDHIRESDARRVGRQGNYVRFSVKAKRFGPPLSVLENIYYRYYRLFSIPKDLQYFKFAPEIAYKIWEEKQKPNMNNYYELNYEDLDYHSLWLDKSVRKRFKTGTQTSKEERLK